MKSSRGKEGQLGGEGGRRWVRARPPGSREKVGQGGGLHAAGLLGAALSPETISLKQIK